MCRRHRQLELFVIHDSRRRSFALHQLWDGSLPVESWINQGLDWVVTNFRPFFQAVRGPIDGVLTQMEGLLQSVPPLWMVAILSLLAWQCAGRGVAIGAAVSLLLVAMLGIWSEAMVTLSLVLTSLAFCLAIGLPLGILLAGLLMALTYIGGELAQSRLGLGLLFITHDLRVAAQLCDRVIVMHQGRIVEQGRTTDLYANPKQDYTRRLLEAAPAALPPTEHPD